MPSWDAEQLANARLIAAVGFEMGMNTRDITIALMAAMQESGLRNVSHGDRDSLGLFQQRPSQGWGSASQVTNPMYAAKKFFSALSGVKGRNGLSLSGAAQAVQKSAFPGAYAKWENDALRLLSQAGVNAKLPFPVTKPFAGLEMDGAFAGPKSPEATTPGVKSVQQDKVSPAAPGAGELLGELAAPEQPQPEIDLSAISATADPFANVKAFAGGGARGAIIRAAQGVLGTPYSWGGGGSSGKSYGIGRGSGTNGFDCSGLVQYALAKAGIKAPRFSGDQAAMGRRVSIKDLQPGDLLARDGGAGGGHIAIYLGGGKMIEAPQTGDVVKISPVRAGLYGVALNIGGTSGQVCRDSKDMTDSQKTCP